MKKLSFLAAAALFMSATQLFASFFETCNVDAKVLSVEELSVFGGSTSVPANVNPDGEAIYTFVNLLTVEISGVIPREAPANCKQMLDKQFRIVLDGKDVIEGLKVGDDLKMVRRQMNGLTSNGITYSETWSLQDSRGSDSIDSSNQ